MSTPTETLPRASLYYKAGNSDKEYHAWVEPSRNGFVVNFSYGRRGSTLQTGSKTAQPVPLAEAQKIFNKLVAEKQAKGYTPGESGTPYQQTSHEDRTTGILPQLLNPIDEAKVTQLLRDDGWCAQQKFDGKRILIRCQDYVITGINRKGLTVGLPQPIVDAAKDFGPGGWLIDGEAVGDAYMAFDLLEHATVSLRPQPYATRLETLNNMCRGKEGVIKAAYTAYTTENKKTLLSYLQTEKREGIVFKRLTAPYAPGRPASGGDQLKYKFTASASCIVAKCNGTKRSVALELFDGARRVAVGNVTVPPNQKIPAPGSILEVRYLYAYPGGSLFQPVLLGVRDDIGTEACTLDQLKYKSDEDEG